MKYNIDGTTVQLRLEICNLQQNFKAIKECNKKLQEFNASDSMTGFYVAFLLMGFFFVGYFTGRFSQ
jgi:hypothetical protein